MLVARIIVCLLAFIALFIVRNMYYDTSTWPGINSIYTDSPIAIKIVGSIAGILMVTFSILLVFPPVYVFSPSLLILFLIICLLIGVKCEDVFLKWVPLAVPILGGLIMGQCIIGSFFCSI